MSNRLIHGEALQVLLSMPDSSVDALITDPPYSSGGQYRGDRAARPNVKYINSEHVDRLPDFEGDNRDQRSWILWCTLWLTECHRVLKTGAPVAVFTDWRQLPSLTDALQAAGFVWRGIAVWDKGGGCRPCKGRPAAQAEYIVWGSKGPMPLDRGVPPLPGVHRVHLRRDDKHHVTGKPTDLMREVVKICEPGGVILDPFAGSGTTGVAALLEGYGFIGIEKSAHYHGVAQARLAVAASQARAALG